MQEISHSHHRYVSAEQNPVFSIDTVIEVFVVSGTVHKQLLNGHIDFPFDLKEPEEHSVFEGKKQLYFPFNDIL